VVSTIDETDRICQPTRRLDIQANKKRIYYEMEEDRQAEPEVKIGDLQHLKRVSRIKHIILEKYLPPWANILGSRHRQLSYFDCFAGPGEYELEGKSVAGSPVIAVKEAIEFLKNRSGQSLAMYLIEDDPKQVEKLASNLAHLQPYPTNLAVNVRCADSRSYIPNLLESLGSLSPSFFLIDPYGHPLPLPVINNILRRERTEALVNLMWFRINMDLSNPLMQPHLDALFGDNGWRGQPFMSMHGARRERAFLDYFKSRLACRYVLPFKVRYDVEDAQGSDRTKYYLLHASNHVKAVLLMKEVMWPLGDEEGTFDFSGESQGVLISSTPTVQQLESILLQKFSGKELGFDELREQTWMLPFVEKHYREVLKSLENKKVTIRRITSKRTGINGQDRIRFK
jgi:three-Cys-motif partner protein